jgi:hypothetical protein
MDAEHYKGAEHYKDTGFGEDITTCFMASHFTSYLVNSDLIKKALQGAVKEEMKEEEILGIQMPRKALRAASSKLINKKKINRKSRKKSRKKSRNKSRKKSRKKSREKPRKKPRKKSRKKSREKGVVRTVQRAGAGLVDAAVWLTELDRIKLHLDFQGQEVDAGPRNLMSILIARIIEILHTGQSDDLQTILMTNTNVVALSDLDDRLYRRTIALTTLGSNLTTFDFSMEPLINVLIWYMWSLPGGLYKLLRSDVMNLPEGQVRLTQTEEALTRVVKSDLWSPPEDVGDAEDADKGLWRADHAVRREDDWIYKRGYMEFDTEWMKRPLGGGDGMACSDNDVYVIDQSCFTATSSSKTVVKGNPEFFGPPDCFRRTLFCIKGIIHVADGQYSFQEAGADYGIPTNKEIYHKASYYPLEEEYLLEPGFFVVKCDPVGTPKFIEEVGPDGTTCNIFNVYYLPKSKKRDFFNALAIKHIVGDGRDQEAVSTRAHLLRILERENVERVYREFQDLELLIRRAYDAFVDETPGEDATLENRIRRVAPGRSLHGDLQDIAYNHRIAEVRAAVAERERQAAVRARQERRARQAAEMAGQGAEMAGQERPARLARPAREKETDRERQVKYKLRQHLAPFSDQQLIDRIQEAVEALPAMYDPIERENIEYEIQTCEWLLQERDDARERAREREGGRAR